MLVGWRSCYKNLEALQDNCIRETNSVLKVMQSGNLSGFVGAWCEEFDGGPFIRKLEKSGVRLLIQNMLFQLIQIPLV